jgi:putative membrane protein
MMVMIKKYWAELILVISTIVGVLLFAVGYDGIILLTPIYLLLNMVLLYGRLGKRSGVLLMWVLAGSIGFVAELVGVHTGLLFGDYSYGTVLGPALFGVPILVAVLWALVMTTLWSVVPDSLGTRRIPLVGFLAVLYDVTLEHFATRFGLWTWMGSIPASNALGWFIVAVCIATLYHVKGYKLETNLLTKILLSTHTLFFLTILILS